MTLPDEITGPMINADTAFMGFGVASGIVAGVIYVVRAFQTSALGAENAAHALQIDHWRKLLADEQAEHDQTRGALTAAKVELATSEVEIARLKSELSQHGGAGPAEAVHR